MSYCSLSTCSGRPALRVAGCAGQREAALPVDVDRESAFTPGSLFLLGYPGFSLALARLADAVPLC